MKDLEGRDDVNWQAIVEAHEEWDYEHEGLSQIATVVIIAVVTVMTAGSGAAVAPAAAGTASAGTGASLFVGATGVGLTATQAVIANAAFTSLASSAALSVAGNKGDLGAVFDDLASSDTLKGVATSALTAGVLQGAGGSALDFDLSKGWSTNLSNALQRATISSVVRTAVTGGSLSENLEQGLTYAIVDWAGQSATSGIGNLSVGTKEQAAVLENGGWEKALAHAIVGCATQAAKGGDCGSGATGAAIAEILSPWLNDNGYKDGTDEAILEVVNSAVALVAKQDVNSAVAAGQQVDVYNRGMHPEEHKFTNDVARVMASDEALKGQGVTEQGWDNYLSMLFYANIDMASNIEFSDYVTGLVSLVNQAEERYSVNQNGVTYLNEGLWSDRELAAKSELTNLVIANNVFETQIAPHIGKPIINANGSVVTTYSKIPTRASKSESEIVRFGESTEYQYESSSIYQIYPDTTLESTQLNRDQFGLIEAQQNALLGKNNAINGSVNPTTIVEDALSVGGILGKWAVKKVAGKFALTAVKTPLPTNVYHAQTTADKTQSVLNGLDPVYFNEESRFGKGFYVGEKGNTAIAEVNFHALKNDTISANYVIGYDLNLANKQVLDLTVPQIAKQWSYNPVNPTTNYNLEQAIAKKAQEKGFEAIRFPSQRAEGSNLVIFQDGLDALKARGVSPAK